MDWQLAPYAPILFLSAALAAVLALFTWRRRAAPGAIQGVVVMVAAAIWSFGYAMELGSPTLAAKLLWIKIKYVGMLTLPVAWLAMALQHSDQRHRLTLRNLALCAAAARGGPGGEPALRAVTSRPAAILGVAYRIGTIAPGRDADLVIADDPQLATGTRIETVPVDGEVVYQR